MKLKNAIKKIEQKGYKAEHVSGERNKLYRVRMPHQRRVLEFYASAYKDEEPTISCIGVRGENDQSDPMTDYCAFVFYDNLSQALR